jgi:uncharacterized protein with LGFP repeats
LGLPIIPVATIIGPNGNGIGQRYANNAYIHSSASGVFVVQGAMLDGYVNAGWVRGPLGWPTANAVCTSTGCTQQFQYGMLGGPVNGPFVVAQPIPSTLKPAYDAAGGAGVLGVAIIPVATIIGPNGNGIGQRYANNAYIHSSASGVFVVQGAMLDLYVVEGWVRGHLGWPTANAVCDATTCTQQFQFGALSVPR